jgi:uncharacterized protein with GYD domain
MKFVLLGHLGQAYIGKPDERAEKAYRKCQELGITVLSRFLTLGRYDYCTVIDAPSAAVASAFDHWYSREGLGDLELLLVHDDAATAEMAALMRES